MEENANYRVMTQLTCSAEHRASIVCNGFIKYVYGVSNKYEPLTCSQKFVETRRNRKDWRLQGLTHAWLEITMRIFVESVEEVAPLREKGDDYHRKVQIVTIRPCLLTLPSKSLEIRWHVFRNNFIICIQTVLVLFRFEGLLACGRLVYRFALWQHEEASSGLCI